MKKLWAFWWVAGLSIAACVLNFTLFKLPTDQELLANFAKGHDFWEGARSVGGWPWWTPNFLGGTTLAPTWGFMATNLWLLLWTSLFGMFTGCQLALLLCLPVAALTAFFFLRAWTGSDSAAMVGALFYIFAPSLWMRIVAVEHLVVVAAMAVLPLSFLGILKMVRQPDARTASLAGASFALLALTYSKAALLALPFLGVFWLLTTLQCRSLRLQWTSPVRTSFLASAFFLGVLPLLPSLRETAFLIFFEHGPFTGWQNAFSLKSAMQFLDRFGELSAGYAPGFAASTGVGGFYFGSVSLVVLVLAWVLWYWKAAELQPENRIIEDGDWSALRITTGMILLGMWFAAGPRNIFSAHLAGLGASATGMDWTVILFWGSLFVVCWLLWKIAPGSGLGRQLFAVGLLVVLLFVPGFRLLEFLPVFDNIRAPFDFFQLPVPLFFSAAVGLLVLRVWHAQWSRPARLALVVLCGVLVVWDAAGFLKLQRENRLPESTWQQFEKVQLFLANDPEQGAVLAISGRYFYLLTPMQSGRPLLMEAFQSYLQQRDFAWLLARAQTQEELHEIGLRLAGLGFVLIDYEGSPGREPPAIAGGMENVFSNEDFGVFGLPSPLYPGFIAESVLEVESFDGNSYAASLIAGRLRFVPLEGFALEESEPGFGGVLNNEALELTADAEKAGGTPWQKLADADWQRDNYQQQRIRFSKDASGWLVLTQAWHPDWRAFTTDGEELVVGRAFGALPAMRVVPGAEVIFRFEPPFWFSLAAWGTVVAWTGFVGWWLAIFFRRR